MLKGQAAFGRRLLDTKVSKKECNRPLVSDHNQYAEYIHGPVDKRKTSTHINIKEKKNPQEMCNK
jgi:hypothetical protein